MDSLEFFNKYIMGSIEMFTGFYFFARFFKRRAAWAVCLTTAAAGIVFMDRLPPDCGIFFYLLLLIAEGVFLCRAKVSISVLYAVFTVEFMRFSHGIFNSLLIMLYLQVSAFCPRIFFLYPAQTGILWMFLGFMALPASICFYRLIYKYFSFGEKDSSGSVLLAPALLIFLVGEYINAVFYGDTVGTKELGNINHMQMLLIQLLGAAGLLCLAAAGRTLRESSHMSREIALLERKEQLLSQYTKEAKQRYEGTRAFRHDIKNHVSVLKGLMGRQDMERALNYIKDMEGQVQNLSFPCTTNHPVADVLLENKLGLARSCGIETKCSLILPYPCFVGDMDLCTILSNAVDNAINYLREMEADEHKKYIRIGGSRQGDFFMLEVENSFWGEKRISQGTGLKNIKAAAKRYHGAVETEIREDCFILRVLLMMPSLE